MNIYIALTILSLGIAALAIYLTASLKFKRKDNRLTEYIYKLENEKQKMEAAYQSEIDELIKQQFIELERKDAEI